MPAEQKDEQPILEGLSDSDRMALELLQKARERREIDIVDAAKRARSGDDRLERDATNAGILAQEVISLHQTMIKLNKRLNVKRALGRSSQQLKRGEIMHWPRSRFGNNRYSISTPVLLSTPPETMGDSIVTDGYVFSTDHQQRGERGSPTISIARVIKDQYTGEVNTEDVYTIHIYEQGGHPYAHLAGTERIENCVVVVPGQNDSLYELPIGLVRLANEELSGFKK